MPLLRYYWPPLVDQSGVVPVLDRRSIAPSHELTPGREGRGKTATEHGCSSQGEHDVTTIKLDGDDVDRVDQYALDLTLPQAGDAEQVIHYQCPFLVSLKRSLRM